MVLFLVGFCLIPTKGEERGEKRREERRGEKRREEERGERREERGEEGPCFVVVLYQSIICFVSDSV